jgi:hypothetical protein
VLRGRRWTVGGVEGRMSRGPDNGGMYLYVDRGMIRVGAVAAGSWTALTAPVAAPPRPAMAATKAWGDGPEAGGADAAPLVGSTT